MAPKPDQMQLEKQKTTEIQRSQQAAEQTQNLQQPLQQNAQTQQNAQQFWTEEMALQEQIPMQSENLSEEMKSAYENVHGQRMGVKSRIWRTERTTKKKREKSNALRAADARYAHNRSATDEIYGMKKRFADFDEKYQQSIKSWMDFSGTKDAASFNLRLLENATGNRPGKIAAIRDIKKKINGWKLEDYQNLDDRQIVERYYDIKDKIEKSKAYKDVHDYGYSIGEYSTEDSEVDLLAKTEYFIRLEPYIQAKYNLITSPYYSLLRKEDLQSLSDDELRQRQEQAGGDMQSFYQTVYELRKMREDARALMADPSAFQENAAQNLLQEEMQKIKQAEENKKRLDEEEKAQRKTLIEPARKALKNIEEEVKRTSEVIRSVSEYYQATAGFRERAFQSQVLIPTMPLEEQKQRLRNFASTDKNVRFAEYQAAIDRMMTCDLSRFKIGTDAQLLENIVENARLLNGYTQIVELAVRAIEQGMEIPKERREEIWKRYSFFVDLKGFYDGQLAAMSMDGYAEYTTAEEPKTLEEAEEMCSNAKTGVQQTYLAALSTKFVNVADGGKLLDCTKTVQELWDSYEAPKMHAKLADAK